MAKNKFFSKSAICAAKSVLFGLIVTGVGLLIVSCAASAPKISEAVRYAPSMDAVSGLNDKLLWIMSHAETGGEYVVMLDSDEGALTEGGNLTFNKKSGIANVAITIKSTGGSRTIFSAHFRVGSGVTLILDSNITLQGPPMENGDGTAPSNNEVVLVVSGGTFVMNEGSAIIGNTNNYGYGIHGDYGIHGGGVHVRSGGAFYMNGGTISGNKCIAGKSLINLVVYAKAADKMLANVLAAAAGTKCSGCDKKPEYPISRGGGVYVSGLSGKSYSPGIFVKTGGTITGYDSDQENGNVVTDGGWPIHGLGSAALPYTVSLTGGHAIYFGSSNFDIAYKIVNTTVSPDECFEFRDGIYKETQCKKPKEPITVASAAAEPDNAAPDEIPEEAAEPVEAAPAQEALPSSESEAEPPSSSQSVQPADSAQEAASAQSAHAAAPVHTAAAAAPAQPAPHTAEEARRIQPVEEVEIPLQQLRGEPDIAAYVFGAKDSALNKAVAARLIVALMNSGQYQALEDYSEFFDHAVKEQKKSGHASLSAGQIKGLGERFGVEYVCVAEIIPVFGEYRVFAYIMRVKTAQIAAKGASDIPLKALEDLTAASEQIVESMFKKAEKPQPPVTAAPPPAPQPLPERSYGPPAQCPPCKETVREEEVEAARKRKSKIGFTAGYGFSGDARVLQFGGVLIQPISKEVVSFAAEANFRMGEWNSNFDGYSETISYYGANVPVLFRFEKSVFFMETGVFADALSVKNAAAPNDILITDIGAVLGGGLAFNKGHTQYFYKFNYGMTYYSHVFGIRQLF